MTAEDRVYAALNVAGVTALVSTRIYPDGIPQDLPLPAIAFVRLPSSVALYTLQTAYVGEKAVLDVYCVADTRTASEGIGDAARDALAAAGILMVSRRGEFDLGTIHYAAVLTVNVWN